MKNQKHVVLHPILFALYPLLELYFNIEGGIPFRDTLRLMMAIPLCALALLGVLRWRLKDWDRAGFLTTLVLFLLLYYGIVYRMVSTWAIGEYRVGRHIFLFPLWTLLIALIGSRWTWRRLHDHALITKFLNFAAAVTLLLSGARYALKKLSYKPINPQVFVSIAESWVQEVSLPPTGPTPDIYYIILDGYGQDAVLRELYDLDNAEFRDFLQSRGFYIAGDSRTNYVQTVLSLGSSLNFAYLNGLDLPPDSSDRDSLAYLIKNSRVRALLATHGYQLVTADSGYDFTVISDADVFFPSKSRISKSNTFEGMVLVGSAGVLLVDAGLVEIPTVGYDNQRIRIQAGFDYLRDAIALPGPKFVFFHIVAPHPPFVFDRHGNPTIPDVTFAGGRDGAHLGGTPAQYIEGYREQLLYVNTQTMRVIEALLTQSAQPPIIILQADHGPGAYLNWDAFENNHCLWERSGILNAYYFPNGNYTRLYPTITPVNSFRVLFNTYFHTELPLLPDQVYFSTWGHPFDFIEVTDQTRAECMAP